jgi:hypothetical protein
LAVKTGRRVMASAPAPSTIRTNASPAVSNTFAPVSANPPVPPSAGSAAAGRTLKLNVLLVADPARTTRWLPVTPAGTTNAYVTRPLALAVTEPRVRTVLCSVTVTFSPAT